MTMTELQSIGTRLLPYATERLTTGKILVSGYFGGWTFLSEEEFSLLKAEQYQQNRKLFTKLHEAGVLLDGENLQDTIARYRSLNRNLFQPPSLHMINTTNTCNYRCKYCHAGVSQGKDRMSVETADKVVDFIFKSGGQHITIEFQGGECLLNWKVVEHVVTKARKINETEQRDLRICIVSNLGLMDEEKLEFLTKHNVSICTSLDGSKEIHDANRRSALGEDTYQTTVDKIQFVQDYYKKLGRNDKVDVLATITKTAIKHPKTIVDHYLKYNIPLLHLRPVQNLGDALTQWPELSYEPEEFVEFWKQAMEYIIELNKQGTDVMERGAYNILSKILAFKDPLYVEMMNPAGVGRCTLLYNFDGGVYSSDEGRMIKEPVFRIGTVDDKPSEVLGSSDNINTWASSFLDLVAYDSAYRPWLGIHPVHVYQDQGTIIPNLSRNGLFKIYKLQARWLFEKISENGYEKELFIEWGKRILHEGD